MLRIAIFGITSAIAEATARIYAARGEALFVVGRDRPRVDAIARDLAVRGAAKVNFASADLTDTDVHAGLLGQAMAALGGLDVVLIAYGVLPDQRASEDSYDAFRTQFQVNALSVISLATLAANHFAAAGHGTLAAISSVAGDRGRQSNYAYGTAKAAVSTFFEGLRNRLHSRGVHVVTIKPGFVDTPMTAGLRKGPLWAQPETVARRIVRAIDRGHGTVYVPGFWRPVMFAIRHVPESVFKRMKL